MVMTTSEASTASVVSSFGCCARPGTAHQVHRTARTAFGEALRCDHIVRNPVALAKAPRVDEDEVDPFEIAEIRQLITAALDRRNGVRFVLALAIGTRQGETIGAKWARYNPETRLLRIARSSARSGSTEWSNRIRRGCPRSSAGARGRRSRR
jgi:integrase